MISYHANQPSFLLATYIKCYWFFKIDTKVQKEFDILPDGYFDLMVIIKEGRVHSACLAGIWNILTTVNYTESTEVIGIRFKPLAIDGLLRFNISEFLNESLDFNLKDVGVCPEHFIVRKEKSLKSLTEYLNTTFEKLLTGNLPDTRLKKCFEIIDTHCGNLRVEEIANYSGISPRQLNRKLNYMLGLSIKDYTKIIRFKNTMEQMKSNISSLDLFYDQSHLIKEIKSFTGYTPSKLNLSKNDRFLQYCEYL